MDTPQSKTLSAAAPSSPKSEHDVDTVFTLPNGIDGPDSDRSVMWHGPNPIGLGGQSPVPKAGVQAWGVTDGVHPPAGAALAGNPGVHTAQTGVQKLSKMAKPASMVNGDVTHADTFIFTKSIMDFETWRQRVMCVRHQARSPTDLDGDVSMLTEAEAFDIVKLGRAFISLNKANRTSRHDTPPSQSSLDYYKSKCEQIDEKLLRLDPEEAEPMRLVMGGYAVSKQSFSAIKSALKSRAIGNVVQLLSSQDALQRLGERNVAWRDHVLHLHAALKIFIEIDTLDRSDCLAYANKVAKPSRSKRGDLSHLPDGWQERFLEINLKSRTYSDAGVLLRHCGLRPTELAKGVQVKATPQGIRVYILGGKVRDVAGQPWRSFLLNPECLPQSFVHRVQAELEITVSAKPNALRAHLQRLSDEVFQQGEFKLKGKRSRRYTLSAYTFRHDFVTDLRQAGWDTNSIAGVIGESSEQTVSYYGTRSRAGSKTPKRSAVLKGSVQTARPVRTLNMDGLERVLAQKPKSPKNKARLHHRPVP